MQQEEMEFERTNFMEYFAVAWKRRWQIIIPTFALAVLAAAASFLLPKVWEVEAIISPSKYLIKNPQGESKQVFVVEPKLIVSQIMAGYYNAPIAAELNIADREFPKIMAGILGETNLIRVSVREKDIERGKKIVTALFNRQKSDFDKKTEVEISGLMDAQAEQAKNKILDLENEIDKTNMEIQSDRTKLKITEQRISSITEEMSSVKTRIEELDKLQQKSLAEKKEGAETLALLLYSNEVQVNLRYLNSLDDKKSAEQMSVINLVYSIKNKESAIRKLQNTSSNAKNGIKLVEDKKNGIEYSQLVRDPAPSSGPISPNKREIVLIAGLIGFCLSVLIAFFMEYLKNQEKKGMAKN